jgi:hypothetical protein
MAMVFSDVAMVFDDVPKVVGYVVMVLAMLQ